MDEQAASERDAIAPQPRTVGRASVPGLTPARPDEPPAPRTATTYTAGHTVPDVDDAVETAGDGSPRIPLPRASEPDADFGLPAVMRGAAEPLPRRRARSTQEFTDGPDPSSGGTPWSPFGADEKPPPIQDQNPYRVRATARVPGSLPPVDAQRADRILPDGPLIDELFFDGPPINRAGEGLPAVATPPSAADYAAALMREWKSENDARDADPGAAVPDGRGDEPADMSETLRPRDDEPSARSEVPPAGGEWSARPGFRPIGGDEWSSAPAEQRAGGWSSEPVAPTASGSEWPGSPDALRPGVEPWSAAQPAGVGEWAVSHEASSRGIGEWAGSHEASRRSVGEWAAERAPWVEEDLISPEPGLINSGRARSVPVQPVGEDPSAESAQPDSLTADAYPAAPDLAEPVRVDSLPAAPARSVPERAEPARSEPVESRPARRPVDTPDADGPVEGDRQLLGLFGDSFDDLSFDRTPFDRVGDADPALDQSALDQVEPDQPALDQMAPPLVDAAPVGRSATDFAALYGALEDIEAAPAAGTDAYWGSAESVEVAPLPRRDPQPIEVPPFESLLIESPSFESPPGSSSAYGSQTYGSQTYGSQIYGSRPVEPSPADASSEAPSAVVPGSGAEGQFGAAEPFSSRSTGSEPVDADQPVIGTVRAAVRVPGLVIERPPTIAGGSDHTPPVDDDRPLAVPRALGVPPVVEKSEPAPDGAIVTYAAEDWRSNVRGSAAVSADSGGTVYVSDVDDDDEDEPLSLTQKLLRSGVIALLVVLFVAAFRYGPNIDEWLHS